ncbi:Zinc finger C2H2-type [Trinorchestia longiramus]|nr:Zinc finger C2H2-type [Trinorchestia longiramus]
MDCSLNCKTFGPGSSISRAAAAAFLRVLSQIPPFPTKSEGNMHSIFSSRSASPYSIFSSKTTSPLSIFSKAPIASEVLESGPETSLYPSMDCRADETRKSELGLAGASSKTSEVSRSTCTEGPRGTCKSGGTCKVCGCWIARGNHRAHMAAHTQHRPLHCAVCGRGFHQTEDLKRHIRIHTGEKPFKCSRCGVAFRQRGHLSRHLFKHHPDPSGRRHSES